MLNITSGKKVAEDVINSEYDSFLSEIGFDPNEMSNPADNQARTEAEKSYEDFMNSLKAPPQQAAQAAPWEQPGGYQQPQQSGYGQGYNQGYPGMMAPWGGAQGSYPPGPPAGQQGYQMPPWGGAPAQGYPAGGYPPGPPGATGYNNPYPQWS